jgi:hypothetical protein
MAKKIIIPKQDEVWWFSWPSCLGMMIFLAILFRYDDFLGHLVQVCWFSWPSCSGMMIFLAILFRYDDFRQENHHT